MKIKVPVKDLEKENVFSQVEEKLKSDPENAYTIAGLMVEVFKVKKEDFENKPFKYWKKGLPTMYTRIRTCIEKLRKRGSVKSTKHGKAWVYWWSEKSS